MNADTLSFSSMPENEFINLKKEIQNKTHVKNSLYIVTAIDTDTKEKQEYEFGNISHALEIYNTLKNDNTIDNLLILEYDFLTKQYHIMEV